MNNVQPVIIVTNEVNARPSRDGKTTNHFQTMAYDNGKAFPQPFEQWIESKDAAHKPGKYPVTYDDIQFRNGDFQVNRFDVLRRGPVADQTSAKPALKTA
jgi:hypothetical protein